MLQQAPASVGSPDEGQVGGREAVAGQLEVLSTVGSGLQPVRRRPGAVLTVDAGAPPPVDALQHPGEMVVPVRPDRPRLRRKPLDGLRQRGHHSRDLGLPRRHDLDRRNPQRMLRRRPSRPALPIPATHTEGSDAPTPRSDPPPTPGRPDAPRVQQRNEPRPRRTPRTSRRHGRDDRSPITAPHPSPKPSNRTERPDPDPGPDFGPEPGPAARRLFDCQALVGRPGIAHTPPVLQAR